MNGMSNKQIDGKKLTQCFDVDLHIMAPLLEEVIV